MKYAIMRQLLLWFLIILVCSIKAGNMELHYVQTNNLPVMMGSLIGWVIYIIIVIIIAYFSVSSGANMAAPQAKQFESPELNASNPIPVLFGTQWVHNMNIVWYGDIEATPWEKCS
jgi:heme/copper-type cytochrome/quinol oxidase subunit 2